MTDRAVAPVVGKGVEAALVVLYVSAMTTVLYGGVVPEYRTDVGDELGERTLVTAANEVEAAVPPKATVPPNATRVERRVRLDLPRTIRGDTYRITAQNDSTLHLYHPATSLGGRVRLSLPNRVDSVAGTWHSDGETRIRVYGNETSLSVTLETA
ncbi:MAG: DUF7266 family protein [Halobacteriota archaeon]